jgi:predicted  nucleic acid-binding Zn-ribbon protein
VVLPGDRPQKELNALRKKIEQLRRDVDELPGTVDVLNGEMEKARQESVRAQQELGRLETVRDYPIMLAEFVKAGRDDAKAIGRLNVLAVQVGKGEEVRRLTVEIREHTTGSSFKEPFTFTPDS